jgi:hypothetical protein
VLNQAQLRAQLYQGLVDMVEHDFRLHPAQVGQRIVLPASFRGFPRFMMQAYQDVMAIVRSKGIPDVFFTFICNPNWQEIIAELEPNQTASDRPDLVARVFQMKVKALLKGVAKIGWFTKVIGNIWTREYREHLDKGIPETRPTSKPSALYISSRAESFHNRRHRSLSVGRASSSREHTSF